MENLTGQADLCNWPRLFCNHSPLDSSCQVDQFLISGSPQITIGHICEWASGNLQS